MSMQLIMYVLLVFLFFSWLGGGRKVTRVEVTLDGGETWMLSEITHPERPTEHGRYWCWCFWRLDVDLIQLIQAKELAVRAWDSSMNTQPQTLTWNVMVRSFKKI